MHSSELIEILNEVDELICSTKKTNGYPGIITTGVFIERTTADECKKAISEIQSEQEWLVMDLDLEDPAMGGYTLNLIHKDGRACGQSWVILFPLEGELNDVYENKINVIQLIEEYKRPQIEVTLYIQNGTLCKSPDDNYQRIVH